MLMCYTRDFSTITMTTAGMHNSQHYTTVAVQTGRTGLDRATLFLHPRTYLRCLRSSGPRHEHIKVWLRQWLELPLHRPHHLLECAGSAHHDQSSRPGGRGQRRRQGRGRGRGGARLVAPGRLTGQGVTARQHQDLALALALPIAPIILIVVATTRNTPPILSSEGIV